MVDLLEQYRWLGHLRLFEAIKFYDEPYDVAEDDPTDVPGSVTAFWERVKGDAHIRYVSGKDGTVHILGIYSSDGQFGRKMVTWLASKADGRLVADEVAHGVEGFWDKMEEEGLIDDWSRSAFTEARKNKKKDKKKDKEDAEEEDEEAVEEEPEDEEEEEPEDEEEPYVGPRPKGITAKVWKHVSDEMRDVVTAIADAARDGRVVRIRYRPKVTEWPRNVAVYRSIAPYSLRVRSIHTKGYDSPPEPTIVLFGYDKYAKGGPSIKMFVVDRIINVEHRGQTFSPRWDVEWENRSLQGALPMCDEELRIVDAIIEAGDLWVVISGIHTSEPMSKAEAIKRKKELIRSGYKARISNLPQEMTTTACVGAYDVPLGSRPIGQRRKRKRKKKKRKAG